MAARGEAEAHGRQPGEPPAEDRCTSQASSGEREQRDGRARAAAARPPWSWALQPATPPWRRPGDGSGRSARSSAARRASSRRRRPRCAARARRCRAGRRPRVRAGARPPLALGLRGAHSPVALTALITGPAGVLGSAVTAHAMPSSRPVAPWSESYVVRDSGGAPSVAAPSTVRLFQIGSTSSEHRYGVTRG